MLLTLMLRWPVLRGTVGCLLRLSRLSLGHRGGVDRSRGGPVFRGRDNRGRRRGFCISRSGISRSSISRSGISRSSISRSNDRRFVPLRVPLRTVPARRSPGRFGGNFLRLVRRLLG
jgi:hypothetical protein